MRAMRHQITLIVTTLVTLVALIAIANPQASYVLDQLLPALMLILGYYFGAKH